MNGKTWNVPFLFCKLFSASKIKTSSWSIGLIWRQCVISGRGILAMSMKWAKFYQEIWQSYNRAVESHIQRGGHYSWHTVWVLFSGYKRDLWQKVIKAMDWHNKALVLCHNFVHNFMPHICWKLNSDWSEGVDDFLIIVMRWLY